jgi:hypothetical protein
MYDLKGLTRLPDASYGFKEGHGLLRQASAKAHQCPFCGSKHVTLNGTAEKKRRSAFSGRRRRREKPEFIPQA